MSWLVRFTSKNSSTLKLLNLEDFTTIARAVSSKSSSAIQHRQHALVLSTRLQSRRSISYNKSEKPADAIQHATIQSRLAQSDAGSASLPYHLVQEQIENIYSMIPNELHLEDLPALSELAAYYFLGTRGKAYRPLVVLLVASLCNKIFLVHASTHAQQQEHAALRSNTASLRDSVSIKQQRLAMICEMIHTASLIHDDVIDSSDVRRGQPTLHVVAGEKKAILTGDYILAVCCKILASLRNPDVIECVAQVVEDLVKGEIVQMSQSFAAPSKRFSQYSNKTYLKTASLIANSCKAAAIFAEDAVAVANNNDSNSAATSQQLKHLCYSFGRNVGMAFQIVDDLLDYSATERELGKPAAGADLRLGIATAPVLYAADLVPNSLIHERISRRFSGADDYKNTFAEVVQSEALLKTRELARSYAEAAKTDLNAIMEFADQHFENAVGISGVELERARADLQTEFDALMQVCDKTLNRDR